DMLPTGVALTVESDPAIARRQPDIALTLTGLHNRRHQQIFAKQILIFTRPALLILRIVPEQRTHERVSVQMSLLVQRVNIGAQGFAHGKPVLHDGVILFSVTPQLIRRTAVTLRNAVTVALRGLDLRF